MKKILIPMLLISVFACAEEAGIVTVTGNRVSLRAEPAMTAVLLDRAMKGDELILSDNSNPEWVGVVPPATVDLWVHSQYVQGGTVGVEKLNVRSGPSLSHSVVGVVTNGQALILRGETAEWRQIAPPEGTVVWISRKYADVKLPEPVQEMIVTELVIDEPAEPEPEPVVEIADPQPEPVEPTVAQVMVAASRTMDMILSPDPTRSQGVSESFTGRLMSMDGLLYRLSDVRYPDITVCYVRGNSAQMKQYAGKELTLTGKTYWAQRMDMPILVPSQITLISD